MALAGTDVRAEPAPAPGSSTRASRFTRNHLVILLTSASVLLAEIAYTRVVSFKLYYYYVYLVIGLALLGLGAGSVVVAVSRRIRSAGTDSILLLALVFGAASTIVSYVVTAYVHINTLAVWQYGTLSSFTNVALILVMCLCIFVSFVGPGVVIATLFSRRTEEVGGLYAADLAGAGIACAGVVYAISTLGAPATIMLAAAAMSGAALLAGGRRAGRVRGSDPRPGSLQRAAKAVSSVILLGSVVLTLAPGILPAQALDSSKYFVKAPDPDVYQAWGPIFRVDVAPAEHDPNVLNLYHDGILGAAIFRWNGTRAFLSRYDFPQDPRSIPFSVLGSPPSHEVIVGAAGGHEVLTSLYYGARHVAAVELNPVTVGLVRTTYADFDGHLAQNPAVDYIAGDGRSYMARSGQLDQLVWYPAPDSYAATNSALASAYVLSESYLYTTNALKSDLQHLTSDGIFVAQFGEDDNVHQLRTTRFVATARLALEQLGVHDPADHIMVAETETKFLGIPLSTIIVGREAFSPAEISRFSSAVARVPGTRVLTAPGPRVATNPVQTVATSTTSGLDRFYSSFPYDVTPTTDNDPYFWHFARYGTVLGNILQPLSSANREDSVGERVLLLLLVLSVLVAAVFLLVPFLWVRKTWRRLPHKALSMVFFAGIGFGFIFFEITLMQVLNLFLGYPTYALTVTLVSLLVFTGIGALLSSRIASTSRRDGELSDSVLPFVLLVIAGLFAFYLFGLPSVTTAGLALPFAARVALTVVMLAPAGLCFGVFLPSGLRRVSALAAEEDRPTYVAWGWAVNGFASVIGAVLATILSMAYGFHVVLVLGLAMYVAAGIAWHFLGRPRVSPALR